MFDVGTTPRTMADFDIRNAIGVWDAKVNATAFAHVESYNIIGAFPSMRAALAVDVMGEVFTAPLD